MSELDERPVPVFRFQVDFCEDPIDTSNGSGAGDVPLCSGAFSDCTGLDATMEPKVIKEGGRNYGPVQRAGQVTFGTVVLKRGITKTRDLWKWFEMVNSQGKYAYRLQATITMFSIDGKAVLALNLEKAMPVKFKVSDLSAKGTEVAIEELHLVHEGLSIDDDPGTSL
jgi:phage tail-like protein